MFLENIYEHENDKFNSKPGTKFKTIQKIDKTIFTTYSEIIACNPPHEIIMHSTSKEGISISKYLLSREYNGTKLVVEASLIPSNYYYKTITKLLGWTNKYIYEEQYQNLKNYLENLDDY